VDGREDLPSLLRFAGVEHPFSDAAPTYVEIVHESVRFEFMVSGDHIRVLEGQALMLQDVSVSPALVEELSRLTTDYRSYRFEVRNGDDVWMTAAERLDGLTLVEVCQFVDDLVDVADHVDDLLRSEFGKGS
jgi:hypothetical protein